MEITTQRLIRSTLVAQTVKELYQHYCQICGQRIETKAGPYAEAAHVRPLGMPHNGPDKVENILCLCPNDHVRFDYGVVSVRDDLLVQSHAGDPIGTLRTAPEHALDRAFLTYHRNNIAAAS
jgi:predicted restriction endonuclease